MNSERLDTLRELVGTQAIDILTDLFGKSVGTPPGVKADRYRADHPEWIDALDRLETSQLFLSREKRDAGHYHVRVYALPILHDPHAKELVLRMSKIYAYFRSAYRARLSNPLPLTELLAALEVKPYSSEETIVKETLFYMMDTHTVWSTLSTGFPYAEGGSISISEAVLRQESFGALLDQFYDWHFFNAQNRANALPSAFGQSEGDLTSLFLDRRDSTRPDWYEQLDDPKKGLIAELDIALANGLSALPTMGLRALLESIMLDHITDGRTFKERLEKFSEAGYMSRQHAVVLESVIDAGHAAIHRAYFPNSSDLQTCVETVKHLIHGVYILKPRVEAMAAKTPKRDRKN